MNYRNRLVSIIIVVKNDRGIQQTLESLYRTPSKTAFEVIVVDGSRPNVLADIKKRFPNVTWEQFPYSAARTTPQQRNRGLELAKGDIIAFLDANCITSPSWLPAIESAVSAGESIVCGPVLDRKPGGLVHYAPEHDEPKYVDVCTTISVAITRDVVETIGGFDPSFSFGQDIDFFWRATDAGYKIYYTPEMAIQHDWGKPKEQFVRAFQYGKSRAHLYKKHWRVRSKQLLYEPHVWVYPVFILGLPLTFFVPFYPLLILVPVLKNWSHNPFGLILHHLSYGLGVISGALKRWPTHVA